MLSTVLDESEGRVVLLDEPASNLHPGMQHKLVEVLHTVPGQVIVVTHSAHMLPTVAEDFRKVRRMQKDSKGTRIGELGNSAYLESEKIEKEQKNSKGTRIGELGNSAYPEPEKIDKELNRSSDVAGLLFASGVILVEGETEIGVLNEWFPKSIAGQGRTFADLNLVLYSVGGKDSFLFYIHFLTAFGVPWAIICDGDALDPESRFWQGLAKLYKIPDVPDTVSFDTLKAYAERVGVYTANTSKTSPGRKFEEIPDVEQYVCNNSVPGGSRARRGRYIAQNISCPQGVDKILQYALQRLGG